MKLPPNIPLYGDPTFRGKCPREMVEQSSIVNKVRKEFPDTWGRLIIHPRNEGLKEAGQFSSVIKHAAEGMTKGASDVIIPAAPSFVCEVKRVDHTKSKIDDDQVKYLLAAQQAGCFACIALGALAAWEAVLDWIKLQR